MPAVKPLEHQRPLQCPISNDDENAQFKEILRDEADVGPIQAMRYAKATIISMKLACILYNIFFLHLDLTDAVYFGVITLCAVGYGDFYYPDNFRDRMVGSFFLVVGSISLSIGLGVIMTHNQIRWNRAAVTNYMAGEDTDDNLVGINDNIRRAKFNFLMEVMKQMFVNYFGWLLVGAVGISYIEGWPLWEGWYWASVTMSTAGYGDIVPNTPSGRWFTSGWMLVGWFIGIELASALIAAIREIFLSWEQTGTLLNLFPDARLQDYHLDRLLYSHTLEQIRGPSAIQNRIGKGLKHPRDELSFSSTAPSPSLSERERTPDPINRAEFILYMFIKTGLVAPDDLQICGRMFDELDKTGDGQLGPDDLHH